MRRFTAVTSRLSSATVITGIPVSTITPSGSVRGAMGWLTLTLYDNAVRWGRLDNCSHLLQFDANTPASVLCKASRKQVWVRGRAFQSPFSLSLFKLLTSNKPSSVAIKTSITHGKILRTDYVSGVTLHNASLH